ncbi:LacI family DNA-binding transcriptional regulator [Paenibacillus humicola]|uniref:LacI family DNA-binding transcriptional regulator n=1 Tax=Paenibacillus humicola TaxID=3110540 RepID=UPI00237AB403|nr:LacI family DNA-binding transcriptional regulator [Paenibacillus humicola]
MELEETSILRKEVAKLAGVSEATVSRVLNGVGPVREETRRRVLEAAQRLDYVPSALAQRFARRKSGNLGVILPLLPKVNVFSTHYFSEILSGIGVAAKRRGYDLLLLLREPEEQKDYVGLFRAQKIDACIVLGAHDTPGEREALEELRLGRHPFCLVNQRFDHAPYSTIDADQRMGVEAAVGHLLQQGCRRIMLLGGPEAYSNSLDRLEGYRSALADAGIPFDPELVLNGNYSRTSGYALAEAVANHVCAGRVDAVIAANDRMAIGLLQGLKERGVSVPGQVALIGCDDSEGARLTDPPLSSIAVPFVDIGREAASRLLDQLEQTDREEEGLPCFQDKLPVRLVPRGSSSMQH